MPKESAAPPHRGYTPDLWPQDSLLSWEMTPVSTFKAWLANIVVAESREFRDTSRLTYTAIFTAWLKFLEQRGLSLLEASSVDAADFFNRDRQLEPVSCLRYLQLLDRIYRHLGALGWDKPNPLEAKLKEQIALGKPLPEGLTNAQKTMLMDYLQQVTGWKGARDRALAALMLGAGLRTNEVIALHLTALTPVPKPGKRWSIPIYPAGVHRHHTTIVLPEGPWRNWLEHWIEERTALKIPGVFACPATRAGKQYCASGLFRRISSWLTEARITTPHAGANILRNTFAQQALTCGRYRPDEVQEFLGHVDIENTKRHLKAGNRTDAGHVHTD